MTDAGDKDFAVGVHFERILETIASRIYDNPFAFLRENVQNAIDAVRLRALRDSLPSDADLFRIDVTIAGNYCTIQDNGIGMNRHELQTNFWTMGASGKNTDEARRAGCIGMFGIGGFANFGVCDQLEVISRSKDCATAHKTSLSKESFSVSEYELPKVHYETSEALAGRGTIVRGRAKQQLDTQGLTEYLRRYVSHVRESVFVEKSLISRQNFSPPQGNYRPLRNNWVISHQDLRITVNASADDANAINLEFVGLSRGQDEFQCEGWVRLVSGQLEVYRRGFLLCGTHVPSHIGVSGRIDCNALQPTAGRDSLDADSISLLSRVFAAIESACQPVILGDPDLLGAHVRLIPQFLASGQIEKLGNLSIATLDKKSLQMRELREVKTAGRRVFFTKASNKMTSASEALQARGNVIAVLSGDHYRRKAEQQYLERYCGAEPFDNLIECLEPYTSLDAFESAVLFELDWAIKKLFSPPKYRLVAGRLTVDVPVYWSDKKEGDVIIVYVDTKHPEIDKLRLLGFSMLLWSMVEAFCREYLGDTLRRQSPKFFGSGSVNLDAYIKSHSELWELDTGDIAISHIAVPGGSAASTRGPHASRSQLVRREDVVQVTINEDSGIEKSGQSGAPAKILNIVDPSNLTGLGGYYLSIPPAAAQAFGELIRTHPSLGVIWSGNRVSWNSTDLQSTAFLFDVTLDRLIGRRSSEAPPHGALEFSSSRLQSYEGQIYFPIPTEIVEYIVPKDRPIRIEVQHQLIDLEGARAWKAKSDAKSD